MLNFVKSDAFDDIGIDGIGHGGGFGGVGREFFGGALENGFECFVVGVNGPAGVVIDRAEIINRGKSGAGKQIFPVGGVKTSGVNLTGWALFKDRVYYMALPIIVITFAHLGSMTRYVRAAMIDALSMDYIRTARAKGLRVKVVIYSDAWRNAMLPVVTVIIGWFLTIFSGSVVVENTCSFLGMGALNVTGLKQSDYELTLAIQLFYTIISLVGILITDISYGLIDPRVRVDK